MAIYRSLYLKDERETEVGDKENTTVERWISSPLAQVPAAGYVASDNYSRESICWLEWVAKTSGKTIQHALNTGEHHVQGTNYRLAG
jgi:hypothetical protein